jgi:large subunit ribosomal protein L32
MAVPRHHMAKGKQGRRRSHLALKALQLVPCSNCKKQIKPHIVCNNCGHYKGREVVGILAKELKKKEKKRMQAQQ